MIKYVKFIKGYDYYLDCTVKVKEGKFKLPRKKKKQLKKDLMKL